MKKGRSYYLATIREWRANEGKNVHYKGCGFYLLIYLRLNCRKFSMLFLLCQKLYELILYEA